MVILHQVDYSGKTVEKKHNFIGKLQLSQFFYTSYVAIHFKRTDGSSLSPWLTLKMFLESIERCFRFAIDNIKTSDAPSVKNT